MFSIYRMHPALFIMASETEYFKVSNKFDFFKGFVPLIRFFNMTIQALINYNFAPSGQLVMRVEHFVFMNTKIGIE